VDINDIRRGHAYKEDDDERHGLLKGPPREENDGQVIKEEAGD